MRFSLSILCVIFTIHLSAQSNNPDIVERLKNNGLESLHSYEMLKNLTSTVGNRLSGSENYEKAVRWGMQTLKDAGCDSVWLEPVMIPHWVRGKSEKAFVWNGKKKEALAVCALGGSIATPKNGIRAEVIEVHSLDEVKKLGVKAEGKIIFYNRPFDKTKFSPFEAYGGAVDQRSRGAIEAAKVGAIGVLARSMTNALDNEPHTGMMQYKDSVTKIPAAAISTVGAEYVSGLLKTGKPVTVELYLECQTLPDVQSSNVIGEIHGAELPHEIILVGGHLDSWDKGVGAHDDGAGIVHSIEALHLIKNLGIRPKRTIRAVLFANEENGLRGAKAYAARVQNKNEKHLAAIESDAGGFAPLGFGVTSDSSKFEKIKTWSPLLEVVGADKIRREGGGADVGQLAPFTSALIGLNPEQQRYFDYHHSNNDTIDKVHPRELELGAIAISILAWLISQEGL
ncbi:MAG: M20/M25/M40 family metallo-hydrolase [Bacteroidota bacterium]|nr:M20/M25/M40 family metallo-hydrolase [Bacteroidota bacterium]